MIPVIITAKKESIAQLITCINLAVIFDSISKDQLNDLKNIQSQLSKQLTESKDLVCPLLKKE